MKTFEKAQQALRRHLLKNKTQVRKDLERMRSMSNGNDIHSYLNVLNKAYSFGEVHVKNPVPYTVCLSDEFEEYFHFESYFDAIFLAPPDNNKNKRKKKDSVINQSLFFC